MKNWAQYAAAAMVALVIASGTSGASGAASAQGQGRGNGRQQEQTAGDKVREALPASVPVFTTQERTVITRWFTTNRSNLPPGLEKQLRERGTLPPGLQKKIQPLPVELERQLTRLPTGYKRVVIGGNVIVMNEATSLIYDIVRNVIP